MYETRSCRKLTTLKCKADILSVKSENIALNQIPPSKNLANLFSMNLRKKVVKNLKQNLLSNKEGIDKENLSAVNQTKSRFQRKNKQILTTIADKEKTGNMKLNCVKRELKKQNKNQLSIHIFADDLNKLNVTNNGKSLNKVKNFHTKFCPIWRRCENNELAATKKRTIADVYDISADDDLKKELNDKNSLKKKKIRLQNGNKQSKKSTKSKKKTIVSKFILHQNNQSYSDQEQQSNKKTETNSFVLKQPKKLNISAHEHLHDNFNNSSFLDKCKKNIPITIDQKQQSDKNIQSNLLVLNQLKRLNVSANEPLQVDSGETSHSNKCNENILINNKLRLISKVRSENDCNTRNISDANKHIAKDDTSTQEIGDILSMNNKSSCINKGDESIKITSDKLRLSSKVMSKNDCINTNIYDAGKHLLQEAAPLREIDLNCSVNDNLNLQIEESLLVPPMTSTPEKNCTALPNAGMLPKFSLSARFSDIPSIPKAPNLTNNSFIDVELVSSPKAPECSRAISLFESPEKVTERNKSYVKPLEIDWFTESYLDFSDENIPLLSNKSGDLEENELACIDGPSKTTSPLKPVKSSQSVEKANDLKVVDEELNFDFVKNKRCLSRKSYENRDKIRRHVLKWKKPAVKKKSDAEKKEEKLIKSMNEHFSEFDDFELCVN